jgi:hypothetical protein
MSRDVDPAHGQEPGTFASNQFDLAESQIVDKAFFKEKNLWQLKIALTSF